MCFIRFLHLTNNHQFEYFTDTGCTFTILSFTEGVELTVYRLSYLLYFPLRYSVFISILFLSFFFQIYSLFFIMLIIPPFISIFTRYTFLISGRFIHTLHKHFGR